MFFFDEAHLLFTDAPKALLDKIEQVVRLIRSKGVGVYFVTQNPLDIPDAVLGQLGNRVQHALRAFTPRDQKAVRSAAETMRPNPNVLGRASHHGARRRRGARVAARREGQARRHGARADRAARRASSVRCPTKSARGSIAASPIAGFYEKAVDRESAYEKLKGRAEARAAGGAAVAVAARGADARRRRSLSSGATAEVSPPTSCSVAAGRAAAGNRTGLIEAMANSAARSVGSQAGRALIRGVLGSLLGGRR